jgi:hypothetical protein
MGDTPCSTSEYVAKSGKKRQKAAKSGNIGPHTLKCGHSYSKLQL